MWPGLLLEFLENRLLVVRQLACDLNWFLERLTDGDGEWMRERERERAMRPSVVAGVRLMFEAQVIVADYSSFQ